MKIMGHIIRPPILNFEPLDYEVLKARIVFE
jgi:hypothetical protein